MRRYVDDRDNLLQSPGMTVHDQFGYSTFFARIKVFFDENIEMIVRLGQDKRVGEPTLPRTINYPMNLQPATGVQNGVGIELGNSDNPLERRETQISVFYGLSEVHLFQRVAEKLQTHCP